MKYFESNDSLLPIRITKITNAEITLALFNEYLDHMKHQLDDAQEFIDIHDLSDGRFVSSEYRILLGKFLKDEESRIKKFKRAFIVINSSLIMATMLKGVFLIQPPPVPYTIVKNLDEAISWINEKFPEFKLSPDKVRGLK